MRDWLEFDLPERGAKAVKLTAKEVGMAEKLTDGTNDQWDPARYHDAFRDDALELAGRRMREDRMKSVGPMKTETAAPHSGNMINLTDLLRRGPAKRGKNKGESAKEAEERPAPRRRMPRKVVTKVAHRAATRRRA